MTVTLNISEVAYNEALAIARSEHISVDEVISAGFAEHLAIKERLCRRKVDSRVPPAPATSHETEQ